MKDISTHFNDYCHLKNKQLVYAIRPAHSATGGNSVYSWFMTVLTACHTKCCFAITITTTE